MAKLQRKIAYSHIIKLPMRNRVTAAATTTITTVTTTVVTTTAGQGENWVAGCGCRPAAWLTRSLAHTRTHMQLCGCVAARMPPPSPTYERRHLSARRYRHTTLAK